MFGNTKNNKKEEFKMSEDDGDQENLLNKKIDYE